MAEFLSSSFGSFLASLFAGVFSTPSQGNFLILACGWALSTRRYFVSNFIWLSGGAGVKHFSRFYYFLGAPFYKRRYDVFGRIIRFAEGFVPLDEWVILLVDDTTIKKSGEEIEGRDRYRNSAGSARQEYRTLAGYNLVYVVLLIRCPLWPGVFFPIPVGVEMYLKEAMAAKLGKEYATRGELARKMVDFVAETLLGRQIQVLGDGGYCNREFLPGRPETVQMIGRMMITGVLYESPKPKRGRGPRRKKGPRIGSPKSLATYSRNGWTPHPVQEGLEFKSFVGIWHTVLPGCLVKVVVVRRKRSEGAKRKQKPLIEAFLSTDTSLADESILALYRLRWIVETDIRDANQFYGLGKNRCRLYHRIVGANAFCLAMAAARSLWFFKRAQETGTLELNRLRPWYEQKTKPSQLDIAWACYQHLVAEGITPEVRFFPDLPHNSENGHQEQESVA